MCPFILFQIALPFIFTEGNNSNINATAAFAMMCLTLLALILTAVLQSFATGAILHIVMRQYMGKKATLMETFSFVLSHFGSLLGSSSLVVLIVSVGLMLCCIPGIWLAVLYAFVVQAVLFERRSVSDSLQRSYSLTTGYRWRVFGVFLLIFIAYYAIQFSLSLGLNEFFPPQNQVPSNDGDITALNAPNYIFTTLISQLVETLFLTYFAVCANLLYLDLRIRKEGFDLVLAAQLDEETTGPQKQERRY
jgi:hypothetical protein